MDDDIQHNQSVKVCIDALGGYSPFSTEGKGVSKGDILNIIRIATVTCFESSGNKETEEQTKLAKLLKPSALLKVLTMGKPDKQKIAVDLLTTSDFILNVSNTILSRENLLMRSAGCLGTHTDKIINPSSPVGTFVANKETLVSSTPKKGLATNTFASRSPTSASGNAAWSAGMRFLSWGVEIEGKTIPLIELVNYMDDHTKEVLGEDVISLLHRLYEIYTRKSNGKTIVAPSGSHKQVLWPNLDGTYILLSPITSFAMVGELESRLRELTRGEDRRLISRHTITLGSGKPQNIGLLALDASGSFSKLEGKPISFSSQEEKVLFNLKNDKVSLHVIRVPKELNAWLKKALKHELSENIAETKLNTNNAIQAIATFYLEEVLNWSELAELNGFVLGVKASKLVSQVQTADRDLKEEIVKKIKLEKFGDADGQIERVRDYVELTMEAYRS